MTKCTERLNRSSMRNWGRGLVLVLVTTVVSCSTSPTFVPGSGNVIGSLSANGATYQILKDANGNLSRIVVSDGTTYDIANGQINMVTTAGGSTFLFSPGANGDITLTFNIVGAGGDTVTFNPDNATGRSKRFDLAADGQSDCEQVTADCEEFLFLINFLPELIDVLVAFASEGDELAELVVRPVIESEINAIVKPIQDFCAAWSTLVLVDLDPCASLAP
ncbi:MAG TPA: hypothetical protein VJZ71_01315 [Phycisphaerae bacterium]|nr:hypothetical protein [Phycisphaerae bacterium]